MKEFCRGGLVLVVCLLAAERAQAQGSMGSFSVAPGPGAASPTQAPGVAPMQPVPATTETTAPPETAPATTPAPPPPPAPAPVTAESPATALPALETPQHFGQRGQIVFSDLLSASLGMLGYTKSSRGSSGFGLNPALDYFVDDDVFIGASSFVNYSSNTAQGTKSYGWSGGAYVHFGRNIPLTDLFSVRPKIALGAWHSDTTIESPTTSYYGTYVTLHSKETAVVVDLYVPVLLHPAQHCFIGFGPDAYFDPYHSFSSEQGETAHLRYFIGASTTVGGWF